VVNLLDLLQMNNQYDHKLSSEYNNGKLIDNPHQLKVYETWLYTIGQVSGLKVLDLACGGGYSSRLLAQNKAHACGVDISKEMLAVAIEQEKLNPLGIKYAQADASIPQRYDFEPFDKVVAAFLLHYASDLHVLEGFLENIVINLKVGGDFVAINLSPDHPVIGHQKGVSHSSKWLDEPWRDGSTLEATLWSKNDEKICSFKEYYWSKRTLEKTFLKFNLVIIDWIQIKDSTQDNNMLVVIKAKKRG